MFKKENLRKNFLRVKQIADQNLGRWGTVCFSFPINCLTSWHSNNAPKFDILLLSNMKVAFKYESFHKLNKYVSVYTYKLGQCGFYWNLTLLVSRYCPAATDGSIVITLLEHCSVNFNIIKYSMIKHECTTCGCVAMLTICSL